jgi:hypothetical protein
MKPRSVFDKLPAPEQNHIIALCQDRTYKQVLAIIGQPRPEGLGIHASESALSRFHARFHAPSDSEPTTLQFPINPPLIQALETAFVESGDIYHRAIIALLQQQVFKALSIESPTKEVSPLLRHLAGLRRAHLKLLTLRQKSPDLEPPAPDSRDADHIENAVPASETSRQLPGSLPSGSDSACANSDLPEISTEIARNCTSCGKIALSEIPLAPPPPGNTTKPASSADATMFVEFTVDPGT